ncbi:hypothetical protein Syun_000922 [Stephania yunnanensis]|uniref:Uncharacterized protein n=1 Tax=Stephania yunnanensis TaxID=152371 RepID=A0AAP0LEJ9_9MAGN
MIRVDFTPMALKNPMDPRTASMIRITPEKPWLSMIIGFNPLNKGHLFQQSFLLLE